VLQHAQRAHQAIDARPHHDRGQHSGRVEREAQAGNQRIEDDGEGDHPHHRLEQDVAELQDAHERDPDPGQRSEQARPRHRPLDGAPDERHADLEEADQDHAGHAHVPCGDGRLVRRHARLGREVGGPEDGEGHADGARRVEAERHRGHVAAALFLREPEGHPGVDEVPEHHAQGGAREHPAVDEVLREAEHEDEDPGQDDQVHHVVEHQAEEGVDVAGGGPAISRGGRRGGRGHGVGSYAAVSTVPNPVIAGVLKETFPGERRVAVVPSAFPLLAKAGVEVAIETGAGVAAGYPDGAYKDKGARILGSRAEVLDASRVLLQVRPLAGGETAVAGMDARHAGRPLDPLGAPAGIQIPATRGPRPPRWS
jgi:hypothetical protein